MQGKRMRLLSRPRHPLQVSLLAIGLALAPILAFADSVPELRALVDANDANAWPMAERMATDNAGDPEFDFWYGLAAKSAGQRNEAVFAFERVVQAQPANARAKLELGDSYFQLGNTGEARRLFDEVLATTPPDAVQQRIRTYLGAIEAKEASRSTQVSSYVTVAGGYDSNVNSATSVVSHEILDLGYLPLPASALETDAGFLEVRTGASVVQPVNQRDLRFLDVSLQARDNDELFSGGNHDFMTLAVNGGWMLQRGTNRWRVPVGLQALGVESDETRYLATVGLELNRPLSANRSVTWFGQAGAANYPSQEARDTWLALAGASLSWSGATLPVRMALTGHVGTEPAQDSDFEFNGRDYVAARATVRYALGATQTLYGGVGVQHSQYQAVLPLLGQEREEMLADIAIGMQWQPERDWSLNADVSYANNASSGNDLYDFERTVVKLGSTWRF